MANTNNGFIFFYDWEQPFSELTPKQFKELFFAMLRYQKSGTPPPEFSGKAQLVAAFVFPQLKRRKSKSDAGKAGMESRWGKDNESDCVNNKTVTLRQDKDIYIDKDSIQGQIQEQTHNDNAVIVLPFADGAFAVAQKDIDSYEKRYPNINVLQELEKIKSWLESTSVIRELSQARHTINGWLLAENQKAPYSRQNSSFEIEKSYDAEEFFKAAVKRSMSTIIE